MPGFRPAPRLSAGALLAPGVLGFGAVAAALLVARVGPAALIVPVAFLSVALCWARPRASLIGILAAVLVVDTANVGVPGRQSAFLWNLTPAIQSQLPLKTSAFEVFLLIAACAVFIRMKPAAGGRRLPVLVIAVPFLLLAGMVYGLGHGGPSNLVYHEARGLIFAVIAFAAFWRSGGLAPRGALRLGLATTGTLGLLVATRYLADLHGGATSIPRETWFGHETGLFLAAGVVLGAVLLLRARTGRERLLLLAYTAFMAATVAMTGRRSGILVMFAGLIVAAWLLFPRRPALLTAIILPAGLFFAVYLQAFWDVSAGAIGEPAQAVRSQFDPTDRDASSDQYRQIERRNLAVTIDDSPLFGVGFGRPFAQAEELPALDFWPLQHYTPHQNLLWLWLKMGVVGLAVFAGAWLIAVSRCIAACRAASAWRDVPPAAVILAAILVMVAVYATIDLTFPPVRPAVACAVVLALALRQPPVAGNR